MKLNLFTTNTCNLNCNYCYEGDKNKNRMTKETGKQIIDFFWDKDKDGIFNINFHGGEPLIEFELIKYLVEYINEKRKLTNPDFRLEFSMTTNGTLLTQEIADFLHAHQFILRLSLDGNEQAHNLHRRTFNNKGSFEQVLQGAGYLRNAGADFTVRMTVTPENVVYLTDSVEWLIANHFLKINIIADSFANWDDQFERLTASFERIKEFYLIERPVSNLKINLFDGKFSCYMLDSPPLFCNAGFGSFSLSTSGEIYPCVYVVDQEEYCIGDIFRGISPLKRKTCIESSLLRENGCGDCSIQGFCHARKCGFLNLVTNGYLDRPNPFLCKHEQVLYSMQSEVVEQLYQNGDQQIHWMFDKLKTMPELKVNQKIEKYIRGEERVY
ncbi:radical SAM protein [Paenibacillus sp. FSL K6-1096]|uniref:radical SAM/SPASM domain-containing protein n=1 Tax=Paenibacillus sp. FSL K6-1096 TaxID=2921460 RepID=UPI0030EF02B2